MRDFSGLERIREYMHTGLDFDTALELTRAGTVFTTHTPVPAGIDRFPHELIVSQFEGFRICRWIGSWPWEQRITRAVTRANSIWR